MHLHLCCQDKSNPWLWMMLSCDPRMAWDLKDMLVSLQQLIKEISMTKINKRISLHLQIVHKCKVKISNFTIISYLDLRENLMSWNRIKSCINKIRTALCCLKSFRSQMKYMAKASVQTRITQLQSTL
jgi:hypothetical protein